MGDRSYFQLYLLDVPDAEQVAVDGVLEAFGLYQEDEAWVYDEASLDTYKEVANALIAAAPGTTFECWNDPKYEYPGGLTMYAPDLGRFDHDCDANGNATFTAEEILHVIDHATDPLAAVEQHTGIAWDRRMAELRKREADDGS